ncbi:proteasome accessory factor PafA2 family protein [Roseiconus lacunae]|uniref:proteasome accessory factor PafA2 family protein n=1 Tax=Roseiconus lacunae TaxID=2605694 RepID=UPI001E451EC6|nr:proteasome accessory factor PafA2 family protein [Roseiconus lacunae]MCD0459043.1 proteasome accessory factor PafA2 family protein [Roseiconus lacunae]
MSSERQTSHTKFESPEGQLVSRLMGLETEYATLIANRPDLATADLPASANIYSMICEAIRRDQPTVRGYYDADQMFLASGGAVTFESHPTLHAIPGGLVEIATPEVSSPDELLACQRSIDQLVTEAATKVDSPLDLRILKNSTDALGHVYGCQENYEAIVATGVWLILYRICVTVLWITQIFSLIFTLPILAVTASLVFAIRLRHQQFARAVRKSADSIEQGNGEQSVGQLFETLPGWIKTTLTKLLRLVNWPTIVLLRLVAKQVAFRKQRRFLAPLLVSRVALCGSGDLDHDGRFRLSAKAMAIDVVSDMGSYDGERPIFVFGHWIGQFCAKSFLSWTSTISMFKKRQRLQIGLSDSNLSDLAEYVKVGQVSLILDMIESGQTKPLLRLPRVVRSLHEITRDWNLVRRVRTSRGDMNAIEIQRHYLKAAKKFVAGVAIERRGEAELVITRWQELLDVVTAFRRDAKNMTPSLGRVDWLSKRWMIDQLGPGAQWIAKKKADLRYHELSPEGYYQKLAASNPALVLIDPQRIEQRRRVPPSNSPAVKRGWLIREFGDGDSTVAAEWEYGILGEGRHRKRIDFK